MIARLTAGVVGFLLLVPGATGRLVVTVQDASAPLPCRIHLAGPDGKPVTASAYPSWKDHFVCDGTARLDLAPGTYHLEIERGPEWSAYSGDVTVEAEATWTQAVLLRRLVDLSREGWWSGELHVHRPIKDVELLMRAEDLHVAPVITWWNQRNLWEGKDIPDRLVVPFDRDRFYHLMGGEDEREGGALMYFGLPRPLDIRTPSREYPSPVRHLATARATPGVLVDIEKPFWWDAPTWLATGSVDTMGIAVNHFQRSGMGEKEAWGKPRPVDRLPPPLGVAYWCQEIYYHALNCGLRLAPSAGSASGVLPNPVGYNRAYVHLDGEPGYESWIEGLRAGRSFVTNGPLLRVQANGQWPGTVFKASDRLSLALTAELDGRDPVEQVEIVQDGRIVRTVPVQDGKYRGPLGALEFTSSGWFLVRCIAPNPKTFRFASTAPFYVEIGSKGPRISRESAQFFLDWVKERMSRIKLPDPKELDEVLEPHRKALDFWRWRVNHATAE